MVLLDRESVSYPLSFYIKEEVCRPDCILTVVNVRVWSDGITHVKTVSGGTWFGFANAKAYLWMVSHSCGFSLVNLQPMRDTAFTR